MTKPVKRVDVSKLTADQREALGQLIRDCKQAAPQMEQMQQAAKTFYEQLVCAPQWSVAEGPRDETPDQSLWHVKPEVNYVDHIEGMP
jgi:hypothetical protein